MKKYFFLNQFNNLCKASKFFEDEKETTQKMITNEISEELNSKQYEKFEKRFDVVKKKFGLLKQKLESKSEKIKQTSE